jgi:hypothetical protein
MAGALVASLAVHAFMASLVPPVPHVQAERSPAIVLPIVIERLAARRAPPSAPKTPAPGAPYHELATMAPRATPAPLAGLPPRRRLSRAPAPVAAASTQATAPSVALVSPSPAQSPAVAVQASPASHLAVGGFMPFGERETTPVLDPRVLHALRALAVHVTLEVTVGDDGRTRAIVFRPPLDPAVEAKIEALLANASWDPAYCGGGIPCTATATIAL